MCARLDWVEKRYRVRLFASIPKGDAGDTDSETSEEQISDHGNSNLDAESDEEEPHEARRTDRFFVRDSVVYIRNPAVVHKLLDVARYASRWTQVPPEELHASSVQHPEHPDWRWLLHI